MHAISCTTNKNKLWSNEKTYHFVKYSMASSHDKPFIPEVATDTELLSALNEENPKQIFRVNPHPVHNQLSNYQLYKNPMPCNYLQVFIVTNSYNSSILSLKVQ
jgi:hypothetical protein